MPEIPEIETLRRQLAETVQNKRIHHVVINRNKTINLADDDFVSLVASQTILTVQRRAKILILPLSNNYSLVFHFMLEGYVNFLSPQQPVPDRAHVIFTFDTDEKLAFFKMHLGYLHVLPTDSLAESKELANLGPEPLSDEFTFERFADSLDGRKGMIKPLLMDQAFLAGIGNAYSNEILFCAKLLPTTKVNRLTDNAKLVLYHYIRQVLTAALAHGGISDQPYSSEDTITGGHSPYLQVAYRTGQPCYVCEHPIEVQKVGGRNAFFCPVCQV